ncbi:hypothetical protein GCM10011571_04230 [Marinithermofilum abyssi]|uniref:Uncharacterized protein n=1 Tax=Marinithermofilum abyssi TaxID=1571185 RepID=A0A8J2VG70_9BACL|nr:hypothetical protein [Marinithermofilum abyssi]GGE06281.1 hypothetical protein GCM10011571_04230 [Marinithermofilum abyssi]
MKPLDKWLAGALLVASVPSLIPIAKEALKPMARNAQTIWWTFREELEDLVAEAQFQRIKDGADHELG